MRDEYVSLSTWKDYLLPGDHRDDFETYQLYDLNKGKASVLEITRLKNIMRDVITDSTISPESDAAKKALQSILELMLSWDPEFNDFLETIYQEMNPRVQQVPEHVREKKRRELSTVIAGIYVDEFVRDSTRRCKAT